MTATRTYRRRAALVVLVTALTALVGVTSAGAGATQTAVETTATIDLSVPAPCESEWTSDGVLHVRGCRNSGVFTAGHFAGGALTAVANLNFSFKSGEGTGWGAATYVTPTMGTWEGSYREKSSLDESFVLTLVGTFVGRSGDGRVLKATWIGTGFVFGVITYAVEGTILDPAG